MLKPMMALRQRTSWKDDSLCSLSENWQVWPAALKSMGADNRLMKAGLLGEGSSVTMNSTAE